MNKLVQRLDQTLKAAIIILAIFMVATVTWQVFSRYIIQSPSSVTEEIARFQLIWIGLLGAVYTFRNRMHVNIDILPAALTGKTRWLAELVSLLACLAFSVIILTYGGIQLVKLTFVLQQTSPSLGLPMASIYSVLPISGVWMTIYVLYFIGQLVQHGTVAQTVEASSTTPTTDKPRGN